MQFTAATQTTDLDRVDNFRTVADAAETYRIAGLVSEDASDRDLLVTARGEGPAAEFAKAELIARCERRLRGLVRQYGMSITADVDLSQAAMLGVLRALNKMPELDGAEFFTYAHGIIVEEIREANRVANPKPAERNAEARYWQAMNACDGDPVRAQRWAEYQCKSAAELEAIAEETGDVIAREIVDARYDRWERNPRGREWEDVAKERGRGLDAVTFAAIHESVTYLDDVAMTNHSVHDGDTTYHELIPDPRGEDAHASAETREAVRQMLGALDDRERQVIAALYGIDGPAMKAVDIAHALGVSRPRVMNIKAKALRKLASL